MMGQTFFISTVWDAIKTSGNFISNRTDYFSDLKQDVESLKVEKERLQIVKEEVEARISEEEKKLKRRTYKVKDWLSRVGRRQESLDEIIKEGDEEIQKKCVRCFFPKNFCSYQQVGKKIRLELSDIKQLADEGNFDVVTELMSRDPVDEKPMEKIVGLDSEFDQVWKCLEDQHVQTIGIYGLGGVGKTTLLKKVNNHFREISLGFDVVISILVSKHANAEKIQEDICNKLGIPDQLWRNRSDDDRAAVILRFLSGKKFVLLLDDVWNPINLSDIGIPLPDEANGSKVVFTTRSEQVCGSMRANMSIKVECLKPEEAWNLFRLHVGHCTLTAHRDILQLARAVAQRCQGLPLALITTGRAMASRRNPKDWKYAIKMLQTYPTEFPGMAKDVFPILKFSYDSLSDETAKLCFSYCCIFPEDYDIRKDELIELWIREGFLDKFNDRYDAKNQGEFIIESLKLACLLEEVDKIPPDYVRMHDVIRDMALWIVSDDDDTKIAVLEDADLIENNGFEKFKQVKRLALLGKSFENLNETQPFPCPLTLLVRDTKLNRFPNGFFQHVQVLNILDLSRNWNLCELPTGIKVLINLQHLNISYTRINSLPHEVKDLIKLKSLVMDGTYMLTDIPKEVISRLLPLQMFSKKQLVHNKIFDECGLLEELDSLENMTEMCITLTTLDSIEKFLSSSKLERCITELWVSGCNNLTSLKIWSLRRRAKQLERLEISKCKLLKEFITYFDEERYVPDSIPIDQDYFLQLRYLKILDCPGIKDLAWVVYAPSIETIILDNCCSIVEILPDYFRSVEIEEEQDIFSKLATLILSNLPKLEHICKKTLPFHSLKLLRVIDCSCLKELPFDSNSAKKSLQVIQSTQEWWNSLQWKDEAKHAFTSKFRPWISQKQTEKSSVSVGIRVAMKHVVLTELMEKEKEFMTKNSDILEMATAEEKEFTSMVMKVVPELFIGMFEELTQLMGSQMAESGLDVEVIKAKPELMTEIGKIQRTEQESREPNIQGLTKGLAEMLGDIIKMETDSASTEPAFEELTEEMLEVFSKIMKMKKAGKASTELVVQELKKEMLKPMMKMVLLNAYGLEIPDHVINFALNISERATTYETNWADDGAGTSQKWADDGAGTSQQR